MRKNLIKKIRKLLKLKNYVTTQEAAQYLTILLGIEVSQAQVLRFALDGSLKLSVYFANSVKAKRGEIVHKDEVASEDAPSKEGLPSLLDRMVDIGDGQYIKLDEDVVSLSGLSDLAMVRSEQLSVEKMYQKLVGGLEVSLEDECEGAFVENEFGFFQLQERIHLDYQKYLSTDLENIKKLIKYNKLDAETANKLLNQNKENREMNLNEVIADNPYDGYYPANLPDGIDFVVRPQALIDFIVKHYQASGGPPINPRAETTYHNIIGAFLDFVSGDAPDVEKHPNFTTESKLIEFFSSYNIPGLGKSTLEMKFAEAKKTFRSNI